MSDIAFNSAPGAAQSDASQQKVKSNNSAVASDATQATDDSSTVNGTPTSTTSSSNSSMTSTFLTLFVAEVQNQDPTSPTDPTAYIDQLSSMSQVAMGQEMSVQMNTNAILLSNLQVMSLGGMVGDDIMVQTTTMDVSDSEIHGRITLDDAATSVTMHFTDEAGADYAVELGTHSPGPVDFDINPADYGIPPGNYEVSVVTDTGESEVPIEVQGVVKNVRIPLNGDSPVLNVAGVGEVPFTMISQFGGGDDDASQA